MTSSLHSEAFENLKEKKDSIDDNIQDEYDEPISSDDNISDEAKDVPVKSKVSQPKQNQK